MSTIGRNSLGWADRCGEHGRRKVYVLPREQGESRTDYARRFFAAIRGLGHVTLHLGRRIIAQRGW